MKYRERRGEKLISKAPLFRDQFDREDVVSIPDVKPLKLRTVERQVSRTVEKAGIRSVERITELHSERGKFRKNFKLTAGFSRWSY